MLSVNQMLPTPPRTLTMPQSKYASATSAMHATFSGPACMLLFRVQVQALL